MIFIIKDDNGIYSIVWNGNSQDMAEIMLDRFEHKADLTDGCTFILTREVEII